MTSPPPPGLRLLAIGDGPGDARALDFCLALPPGWSATLFSPLPGTEGRTIIEHGSIVRELRQGLEPLGEPLPRPPLQGDTLLLDLAAAAARNAPLRAELRRLAGDADLVLHFSPWSARACRGHGRPEVYSPAGFMLGAVLEGLRGPGLEAAWAELWALENGLAQRAALLLSPSPLEANVFRLLYGLPPTAMEEAGPFPPAGRLARLSSEPPAPRTPVTLALNDYPLHNPRNGGAVRSLGLLGGLSRDVVAITLGPQSRFVLHGEALLEVCLPRPAAQRLLGRSLQRIADAPIHDLLGAAHVADMPLLARLLGALGPRLDATVFEHPYMAPLLPALRRAAGSVSVVLHAHNVEGPLKAELLEGHPLAALATSFTEDLERQLTAAARLVICCSEADAEHFRGADREVLVVPHDAVLADEPREADPAGALPLRAGFLASAHGPNRAAARFIAEELAPAFPEVVFEIVGSVGETLSGTLPANLIRHGVLPDKRMRDVLATWSVALNPVETGGGASVKLAQYLALGLPSISTPHAARGFAASAVAAGLVVPLGRFPAALRRLLSAPGEREALAADARRHWASPARWAPLQAARTAVAALAGAQTVPRPPRRLLAIADDGSSERAARFDTALEGLLPGFSEVEILRPASPAAPPSPERLRVLGREAETILADFAPLLPSDAPPMPWTGFLPAEPRRAGRQASARFGLLLPAGAAWVQLRLSAPRPLALRLHLRTPEGAKLAALRSRRVPAAQSLLELDLSRLTTARPALLLAEVMDTARWKGTDELRLLQFACGAAAGGPPRLADLHRDAMDAYRSAFPQHWRESAWRVADRRSATERVLLGNGQTLAEAALAEAGGTYDHLLLPAEAASAPARAQGGPRVLAVALGGPDIFGTVPEATGPGLRAAHVAVAAFPGMWPVRPASGEILRRMREMEEEAPLHRIARGRAALGLRQPYLLAASLDGAMPVGAEALHALTAPIGLDLVLAGGGRARRLPPEGEAVTAAVPLAGLLGAKGVECCGLWLPEAAADERALIALAWLTGVPVMAAFTNWYARQSVQQSVTGLLLRPPHWNSLEAVLRQPALRVSMARGGADALHRWLEASRSWAL
ncbi:glycosyltransferase family 1 protein [Roseomonas sp. KE2513]|uniref:glycosyltransferase n=1 Tax=Roseomonas sp. KE2513 TaxID=2479202 RepID=UPI0018E04809|nr:glycosyltransferase [Roseomonas sp. KE2513]MBI0534673.1 glycosyltransferase family 1 protein [Roseomonas sp. KE2513]